MNGWLVNETEVRLSEGLTHELSAQNLFAQTSPPAASPPSWLRLAYSLEFLIALIAITNLWVEVGGGGHLELMPWHVKLVCIVGLAWCCVRFTASRVEQPEAWSRHTIAWLAGILLFCVAMGGITYYYHLHEEPDEGPDDTSTAALSVPAAQMIS